MNIVNFTPAECAEFADNIIEVVLNDGKFNHSPKYGTTVLRVPSERNPKFHKLAVTYCSPNEVYNKARGKLEVMRKMATGKYILVPHNWIND